MLLTTRIVWNKYSVKNMDVSTIMYNIVNSNCINPTDVNRKIPFLELAQDTFLGGKINKQVTGGEVYDVIVDLASSSDLGFNILFRPRESKLIFEVVQGIDRTINQSVVDPIEFSTDWLSPKLLKFS